MAEDFERVQFEQTARYQLDVVILPCCLAQQFDHIALDLDGHNAPGLLRQFPRQNAGSRANFQHLFARFQPGSIHDLPQDRTIHQKILPKRFIWAHVVSVQQVAQLVDVGQIYFIVRSESALLTSFNSFKFIQ
jgi:hypothetical protein